MPHLLQTLKIDEIVGKKQKNTLEALLEHMRMRAQLSQSVSERISITRDIALFSLAFYTMRRGVDYLSCTLGSQVLQLPDSAGMIYNFHFGKT